MCEQPFLRKMQHSQLSWAGILHSLGGPSIHTIRQGRGELDMHSLSLQDPNACGLPSCTRSAGANSCSNASACRMLLCQVCVVVQVQKKQFACFLLNKSKLKALLQPFLPQFTATSIGTVFPLKSFTHSRRQDDRSGRAPMSRPRPS